MELDKICLTQIRQRGQGVAGKNICGGALFGLKPSRLFSNMGHLFCAMPCRIKPIMRLNAAHKMGIPFGETKKS